MVTLAQLLAVPDLKLVPVVLPEVDPDVRWVATSELVDPTPFLEGGEVLLTTGLETKGWRSEWSAYVERLRITGVVAVGLGTGLTHRRPPASLVAACRAAGLGLFEVPRPTSFVSVSRAHVRLQDVEDQSVQRRVLAAQRELTTAAVTGTDDQDVVSTLAGILGADVALVDVQKHGPIEAEDAPQRRVWEEIQRMEPLGLRAAASFSGPGTSTSIQPVGLGGRPAGYLVVTLPRRPDDLSRAVTATALSLLSLGAARRRREARVSQTLENAAWDLLVGGHHDQARTLLREAGRPSAADGCQVMCVSAVSETADLDEVWERARAQRSFWMGHRCDKGICLAWSGPADAGLARELGTDGCAVGIGELRADGDLDAAEATARRALDVAGLHRPVVEWDELARSGAVDLLDPDRARAFAESLLSGLDDQLLTTLAAFLEHHGSRGATAEALGVHRNTVRNRIEAVENRWGRSLDDPALRFDAWVALQIRAVRGQPLIGVTARGSS